MPLAGGKGVIYFFNLTPECLNAFVSKTYALIDVGELFTELIAWQVEAATCSTTHAATSP